MLRICAILCVILVSGTLSMPPGRGDGPDGKDTGNGLRKGWGADGLPIGLDPDNYLEKFGYLIRRGKGSGIQHSDESRKAGIRQFQKRLKLKETGVLNEETLTWMTKPRCGMPDQVPDGSDLMLDGDEFGPASDDAGQIAQSFSVPGSKWSKKSMTYRIHNFSPDLDQGTQRRAIWEAFKYWSDVADLQFSETTGEADINIKFTYSEHGDGSYNAFDGQGGVLAHAFFPENGETHFDESETWTDGEDRGTNLAIVAAHELGHALGLGHSEIGEALMAPYYQGYIPNFQLHADDIAGVQKLYGQKQEATDPPLTTTTTTPSTTTTEEPEEPPTEKRTTKQPPIIVVATEEPVTESVVVEPTTISTPTFTEDPSAPDECTTKFDAVFQGPDYKIYILKYKWVWRLKGMAIDESFPTLTSNVFSPPVPTNIGGAVFSSRTGRLYFFKGKRVWRYQYHSGNSSFTLDFGFPMTVAGDVYPDHVDSAMTDRSGRIYLFRNDNFYLFSEYQLTVDAARPISGYFSGVPNGIEAAVTLRDGYTYFFKGTNYRKYLTGYGVVDGPVAKAGPWMGCGEGHQPK
ncbi:matrix metalloproteinase-19-like [Lineus longissimus]|uniref:matrix metalloproteinase-19-like n=1 Tax=Lineus longissimus TaxID=88925 RepID=UPI002B4FB583